MAQPRAPSQTRVPLRTGSRSPITKPATPLRPSSRSSFRTSQNQAFAGPSPLDALEPQFAELSDSMADLEANLMHLQLMHESLSRFGESFASFLYGLNMNAFVVDFPEAPIVESIKRHQRRQGLADSTEQSTLQNSTSDGRVGEGETSFMSVDASVASMKTTPRRKPLGSTATPGGAAPAMKQTSAPTRSGMAVGRAKRGTSRDGTRGSGLPLGRGKTTR